MIEQGLLVKIAEISSELIGAMEYYEVLSNGSSNEQKIIAEKEFEKTNKKIVDRKITLLTALNDGIPIGATLFSNKESYSIGQEDLENPKIKGFLVAYHFYRNYICAN